MKQPISMPTPRSAGPCARIEGAPYDVPGLIAEMDHCRISRALVFNAAARELDSRRANRELAEQISGVDRLAGQAVISAAPWSRERNLSGELSQWLELGFRSFRVFPLWQGMDIGSQCDQAGAVLSGGEKTPALARLRPVLVQFQSTGPARAAYDQFCVNQQAGSRISIFAAGYCRSYLE